MRQTGWRLLVKKAADRAAAAIGILVTAPLMGGAAIAIQATMGAPIFFRQKRPGLMGKPFEILKFRTMTLRRDEQGRLLPDAQRMTKLGTFLRRSSIDELPQLLCVLKGDLSLVGPRPLMMDYLDRYTPDEARRHDVMPGISGLAQITGRNSISWEEKFRLDLEYVDGWSLALDAKIVAMTVWTVLRSEGISSEGHETMPPLRPHLGATRAN